MNKHSLLLIALSLFCHPLVAAETSNHPPGAGLNPSNTGGEPTLVLLARDAELAAVWAQPLAEAAAGLGLDVERLALTYPDEPYRDVDAAKLKRARGRRGLALVTKLQQSPYGNLSIDESEVPGHRV